MICSNCRFENEKNARYCVKCGSSLQKNKSKKLLIISLIILVFILIMVSCFFIYKKFIYKDNISVYSNNANDSQNIENTVWYLTNSSAPIFSNSIYEIPVYDITATSVIDQDGYDNSANMVIDRKDETSWQEGVDGDGTGEKISMFFDQNYKIKYIAFKLGNWRSYDYYLQNNRPKTLSITMGGQTLQISFSDLKEEQWVAIEGDCYSSEIIFEILSTYSGNNPEWNDTCISEISVYGEGIN